MKNIPICRSNKTSDKWYFVLCENYRTKRRIVFSEIIQKSLDDLIIPNQIIIKLPLNDYKINADKIKLQTVISNLIKNSIDAIDENGIITVDLKNTHDFFCIFYNLFCKRFQDRHIENSSLYTIKLHGTGLGLVSCKKIV